MPSLATYTPAMLMKDYIIASGRGGLFNGWVFKFGLMPDGPDQVICLIDQGGPSGIPNLLVDYPGLQILVRSSRGGNGYQTSYTICRSIRDIILGMQNKPAEFTELCGVTERGTNPVALGYDDKERHTWSSNYQLLVEPETNALTQRGSL